MENQLLLRALKREFVERIPVWFMRQAGRFLPEYRKLRDQYDIMTLCKTAELAMQVTLMPIKRFDLDAAIIFSDIMIPLEFAGIKLTIKENFGPVIDKPIISAKDIDKIVLFDPEISALPILKAIKLTKQELADKIPLIGFAGAPFTLASYLIEGGSSRSFVKTKQFIYSQPESWHKLMDKLTSIVSDYLITQVKYGADVVQLFDSWIGTLSPLDYASFVLPYVTRVFEKLRDKGIPSIYFGVDTAELLLLFKSLKCDAIGVDWRINIDKAWEIIGNSKSIQGNLDPSVLLGNKQIIRDRVVDILKRVNKRNGYIFNLGHGILPETPIENAEYVIKLVHDC